MIALVLDAATYSASIAVLDGDSLRASTRVEMRGADEERLLPAVAALLEEAGIRSITALDRITCGAGPGSFTSLRIAASIAKGLAFGGNVPLHAVSSLGLIVAGSAATRAPGRYVAAIDALRGEHYAAVCAVDAGGQVTTVGAVERWPSDELRLRAAAVGPLVGPGLEIDALPEAASIRRIESHAAGRGPVDLAAWEPDYGRLAEAQVKWEAAHGRALPVG